MPISAWQLRVLLVTLTAALLLPACSGGEEEPDWKSAPIVPAIAGELRTSFLEDVAAADRAGRRPAVFAKVGDSNTDLPWNLSGLGCREIEYGDHGELEPVVELFRRTEFDPALAPEGCQPANSFSRDSAAVLSGSGSVYSITPGAGPGTESTREQCLPDETYLACEARLISPRYALVLTGTNDLNLDRGLDPEEAAARAGLRLGTLVDAIRDQGVVPVLSTVPPVDGAEVDGVAVGEGEIEGVPVEEMVERINEGIHATAKGKQVPLINLWRALEEDQMVDHGLLDDGLHLAPRPGPEDSDKLEDAVDFSEEALRYGANRRNLIWVETLAALETAAAGN